jgi:hypothetical protein
MRCFSVILLIVALCSTGCSSSSVTVNSPKTAGQSCAVATDCATGLVCGTWGMSSPTCTQPCSTTADCQDGAACITPPDSTEHYCVPPCTASAPGIDLVCVNGIPTSCDAVPPGSYCSECSFQTPCPQGDRCDALSDQCVPLPGLGSPCSVNGDCMSNNCGTPAGTTDLQCLVSAGSACTAQNCGSCDTTAGGAGCAQSCTSDTDCPILDDDGSCHPFPQTTFGPRYYPCIGTAAGGYFCRQPCDGVSSDCPPGLACSSYTPGQCSDYLFNDACQ